MKRCAARARAEGDALVMHDVPLRGALHGSWVHSIERGRIRVIQQFLRSRCAPDVRRVTLERRCEGVDARVPAKVEVYEFMCAAGEFHMTGVD